MKGTREVSRYYVQYTHAESVGSLCLALGPNTAEALAIFEATLKMPRPLATRGLLSGPRRAPLSLAAEEIESHSSQDRPADRVE